MRRERNAVPRALILVAAVFVVGTVGYRLIEGSLLQTGDVVVVFGSSAQIAQFEEKCGGG